VVRRKNWLFSGSPGGAHASAFLYSLIETAKANRLETVWYMQYLFDNLPHAKTRAEYRALLPYNTNIDKIADHFKPLTAQTATL